MTYANMNNGGYNMLTGLYADGHGELINNPMLDPAEDPGAVSDLENMTTEQYRPVNMGLDAPHALSGITSQYFGW